jgi:hypothetical protein
VQPQPVGVPVIERVGEASGVVAATIRTNQEHCVDPQTLPSFHFQTGSTVLRQQVDFLKPGIDQIRHEIRGICDSYSHEWDLLAELSQNAIDAVIRREPTRGHLVVSVDAAQGRITFEDNGTGIDPESLAKLLGPFATDKIGSNNQIGQKGGINTIDVVVMRKILRPDE